MGQNLRFYIFPLCILSASTAWAAKSKTPIHEIKVKLFAQPCTLTGPLSESQLQAVHSISPEQLPPPESADQTAKSIERLKNAKLPQFLEDYRRKLGRFLDARAAFFSGAAKSKKSGSSEDLLSAVKPYLLPGEPADSFTALAKSPGAKNEALLQKLDEAIEGVPEEAFHKAIERNNVRYVCTFEEESSDDAEE